MIIRLTLAFSIVLLFTASCGIQRPGPSHARGPVVVYKTRKDYREHVSVQLSEDGSAVLAYPGPGDVLEQRPVELAEGYLLKRMPGNVFVNLTIDEYASTSHAYSAEELHHMIIDDRPYLEIYDCSECSDGDTASINKLIRQELLSTCKSLR